MKRRRRRVYRKKQKNSMMKLLCFLGIIIIAVIAGYLTARYIIGPILGYDTEVLKIDFPSVNTSETSKTNDKKANLFEKKVSKAEDSNTNEEGFYLQFGVFENRDGAEELAKRLQDSNIDVDIVKKDGKYKVLSSLITSKEKAIKKLKNIKSADDIDVFITSAN